MEAHGLEPVVISAGSADELGYCLELPPDATAKDWTPPKIGLDANDIRQDPLVETARQALLAQRMDDMDKIHKRVQEMRQANRKPNTTKGYKACWRLWQVSLPFLVRFLLI